MEAVHLNLWAIPLWIVYGVIAYWFCGWQLQHVWHFHPFLRWLVGHFWHAAIIAALLDVWFELEPVIVTGYFMGTLGALELVRMVNPINTERAMNWGNSHSLTPQDRDTWLMFGFHLIALSVVL